MKIVLTNDDGIDAPGISALADIAADIGTPVIVAPKHEQSGMSHRVTARKPIPFSRTDSNRYWVDASPADCSRVALKHIAPDADWIIAGINPGANLGSDVYNSGTVAAAREAAILGCKAMAVSQYIARDQTLDWNITRRHARDIIQKLIKLKLPPGCFWNVNLPHPLEADEQRNYRFCDLDINPHAYEYKREGDQLIYRGLIHNRYKTPGKDVAVCFGGEVSITLLAVGTELPDLGFLEGVKKLF